MGHPFELRATCCHFLSGSLLPSNFGNAYDLATLPPPAAGCGHHKAPAGLEQSKDALPASFPISGKPSTNPLNLNGARLSPVFNILRANLFLDVLGRAKRPAEPRAVYSHRTIRHRGSPGTALPTSFSIGVHRCPSVVNPRSVCLT